MTPAEGGGRERRRIFVNGRFLGRPPTGVDRYALELLRAIDRLRSEARDPGRPEIVILAPRGTPPPAGFATLGFRMVGRFTGQAWEQFELPFFAGASLLFNPCNTGPLLAWNPAVTLHDAAVFARPAGYSRAFRAWYRLLVPALGRRARAVLTISAFSRDELARRCGIDPRKIAVIPLGHEHILAVPADERIIAERGLDGRPYVFAAASLNPNKNFAGLIAAYASLADPPFDLVLAGGGDPAVYEQAGLAGAGPAAPTDRIKRLGYVDDASLRALYEHAGCFAFPSFYEGFGLPPVEAMALGCPVVCSSAASLPEVCGEAAVYFDPARPAEIAARLVAVMGDAALRRRLAHDGRIQAARYTWRGCAERTLARLEHLIEG